MHDDTVASSALAALALLRDPAPFQWYVIPLFLLALHVYALQIHQRNWSIVLGGLAFWCMDWINEIWNGLLFHFSGYAPAWAAPADTAYLILIGLNIEISLMFAVMGVTAMLTLPRDPMARMLGLNNRLVWASVNSALAVLIEIGLNRIGALTWEWPYWRSGFPWLIFLVGYLPFFLVGAWVHDMHSRRRQLATVAALAGVVVASLIVFGGVLGWI